MRIGIKAAALVLLLACNKREEPLTPITRDEDTAGASHQSADSRRPAETLSADGVSAHVISSDRFERVDKGPLLKDFALLADVELVLMPHAEVLGDCGVGAGIARMSEHSGIDGKLYATSVEIAAWGSVGSVYSDNLTLAANASVGAKFAWSPPPPVPDALVPRVGAETVTLRSHQTRSLNPGQYLDVEVGPHATLNLTGGRYEMRSLRVRPHGRLMASKDALLVVSTLFKVEPQGDFRPVQGLSASALRVDYRGRELTVEPHATIRTLMRASSAAVKVAAQAIFTGAILARTIAVGAHAHVTFEDGFGCRPATCDTLGVTCGAYPDGCGGVTMCGSCAAPQTQCFGIDLEAAELSAPLAHADGIQALLEPLTFALPATIPVVQGTAAGAAVTLTFARQQEPPHECFYRADQDGASFAFASCVYGEQANELIVASELGLRLRGNAGVTTSVSLRLNAQPCNCIAATCEALEAECGVWTDGCGGLLQCGGCTEPSSCGGNAASIRTCGCVPRTCDAAGATCGFLNDGCGGAIFCGDCGSVETCGGEGIANVCGCAGRNSCAAFECGQTADGCGGTVNCGVCPVGTSCGGGGVANRCGCTRATCSAMGRECGYATDGCDSVLACGSCGGGETCDNDRGVCVRQEYVTNAAEPELTGAELYVPEGAANGISFSPPHVDPLIPVGSLLMSSDGPVVTVGPLIEFAPSTSFSPTSPCATLKLPYDAAVVDGFSSQSVATLQAYLLSTNDQGDILLVPASPSQRVDQGAGTVQFCTHHLSGYVVALKVLCTRDITSPVITVASGTAPPVRSNVDWRVSTANTTTVEETLFGPYLLEPQLVASGNSPSCVGVLLLYGGSECPLGSPGGLCAACVYDNAETSDDACFYPFERRTTACPSTQRPLVRRGCFSLLPTSDATSPPAQLGNLAAYAATIVSPSGEFLAAAWVDPRARIDMESRRTSHYNLTTWFIDSDGPASAFSAHATLLAESHPRLCVTRATAGVGSRCGVVEDGCGGTIGCGGCAYGLTCEAGVCECPFVAGSRACPGEVTCGGVSYDPGNPCQQARCVDEQLTVKAAPDGTFCGDSDGCNGIERCYAGVCRGGVAPLSSDGDPCTDDSCPPGASGPVHATSSLSGCQSPARCCSDAVCSLFARQPVMTSGVVLQARYKTESNARLDDLRARCPACAAVLGGTAP